MMRVMGLLGQLIVFFNHDDSVETTEHNNAKSMNDNLEKRKV